MDNYEQKYKNALSWMQSLYKGLHGKTKEEAETYFPELKESEDERMLREIKRYIKEQGDKPTGLPNGTVAVADMIAWLEKQGEQKPIDELTQQEAMDIAVAKCFEQGEQKPAWSEEDEKMMNDTLSMAEWYSGKHKHISGIVSDWLESLKDRVQPKPKQEWSEEDESNISELCSFITESYCKEDASKLRQWLLSLRPQNTWKPSDEQMDVLLSEVSAWTKGCPKQIVLESLYQDLKELRGEK